MTAGEEAITVDRAKLSEARAVLGMPSAPAVIDGALSEVLRHRVLHDVDARMPPADEEAGLSRAHPDWDDLADDTDWDADWPEDR